MQNGYHHNTFTAQDIERYYNGQMPAAEMHALEKAALDDPFLADALEGYQHTQTPVNDVAYLKNKIAERRNKKIFLMQGSSAAPFLKVAAMVLLLAGAGLLIYQYGIKKDALVAFNKKEIAPQKNADTVVVKQGTQSPLPQNNTAQNPVAITRKKERTIVQQIAAKKDSPQNSIAAVQVPQAENMDSKLQTNTADSTTFSNTHAAVASRSRAKAANAEVVNTFAGQVVDSSNKAIPFANIFAENNTLAITTDAAGNFAFTMPDSSVHIAVNAVGYLPSTTLLHKSEADNKIVLKPSNNALSEVVIATKKKNPSDYRRERISLQDVTPLNGWNAFNDYVAENLEPPEESGFETRGEVLLSFDVDKNGKAINVSVEKSLCSSCDAAAVQLIKEGSRWKKKDAGRKAKASIRF